MDAPLKYQPFTYIAASSDPKDPYKNTELYRFRVINGAMERVSEVPVHEPGYEALAYRPSDGLLYAMENAAPQKDVLLIINPKTGRIDRRTVSGMPPQQMSFVLGDIAPDGKTYVIGGGDHSPTVEIDLTQKELSARKTAGVPGEGGHYDWAFHPLDKRLYAIDGDTGALLVFDLKANQQKQVLKTAFAKAQGPEGTGIYRPVYGAVFFSDKGMMYAIDSAGNVYSLDLTRSSAERPLSAEAIPSATPVGGGAIKINGRLRAIDAAGCVITPAIPPIYINPLLIKAELKNVSNTTWLPPDRTVSGNTYTWRLTLTAKNLATQAPLAVKTYRIQFELPTGGEVLTTSDLAVEHGEAGIHAMVYLKSLKTDHFIQEGDSLTIDCPIFISGEKLEQPTLVGLAANRVS